MTFWRPISPSVIGLVQMGVLELHTWGAKRETLDRPDRIIMDLDQDPTIPWKVVVEAAQLAQALRNESEIECAVKMTGGKALHVVLPLQPVHTGDRGQSAFQRISGAFGAPHPGPLRGEYVQSET